MMLTSSELDRMIMDNGFREELFCSAVTESAWRDSGKPRVEKETS
jgi:hypothetical protein